MSVGSAGDVHPFVAVALGLRERGHIVSVATNPYFAPLLEQLQLPLVPVGTVEQFDQATAHPALWHQVRAFGVLAAIIRHSTPALYRLVEQEAARGDTVVVAHPLAFGARIAHETLGVPLVTLHLAPSTVWSLEEPPVPARWIGSINAWPKSARRLLLALGDRFADRALAPALNRFRAELGLAPARHIASRWWHSPQHVIGLFPDWFAAPQPDWPSQDHANRISALRRTGCVAGTAGSGSVSLRGGGRWRPADRLRPRLRAIGRLAVSSRRRPTPVSGFGGTGFC